ncbi:unnamed protein product [Urochloa decumbens]|uniref:Uncharacterized protein n=1 Tax=Urochloa decumbens TaxID=240449 RepID=A0ABC9DKP3_9POAL
MKVNRGSDLLVHMMIILSFVLFGFSALVAQCTGRSYPNSLATSSANVTSVDSSLIDESKLNVIFCGKRPFCDIGECYCCLKSGTCWDTREECQANCPTCSPHCPTQRGVPGKLPHL